MTHAADTPANPEFTVVTVCLGNICRSPMAAAVLRRRLELAGLDERVLVESAGTAGWHVGAPADPRAATTLLDNGYDATHQARRFNRDWADTVDLILAMDASNYTDLAEMTSGLDVDLRMFREFDPQLARIRPPNPALNVPDPYYGADDGFTDVLTMLEQAAGGIVEEIAARLADSETHPPRA